MFFQGTDPVHRTMDRVTDRLREAGLDYAIVGGMAVNAHRYHRTTADVDFLLRREDLEAFIERFVPVEFERLPGRPRRFLDPTTDVTFDVLVTGLFPGSGKPGPITFPNPSAVNQEIDGRYVIKLVNLIELKLAAGRYQGFADVVALVRENNLDESFARQLHSQVRSDYIECLEEKRREDEYEAHQDEQFREKTENREPPVLPPGPADSGGPPAL
jgi:hypothetical protein